MLLSSIMEINIVIYIDKISNRLEEVKEKIKILNIFNDFNEFNL